MSSAVPPKPKEASPAGSSTAAGGAEEELIQSAYATVAENAPWRGGVRWELVVALGVGLVLYGLIAAVSAIAHRDQGIPVVALLIAVVTVVIGAPLILNGRSGIDALRSTFVLLGIVLLVGGVVLAGYGLMIRNAQVSARADDDRAPRQRLR